jgi:hypothetical protein
MMMVGIYEVTYFGFQRKLNNPVDCLFGKVNCCGESLLK